MAVKILSVANSQTDSIKIDHLLTKVNFLNFQPIKIQNINNIFSSIQKYNPKAIIWGLDRCKNSNLNALLKIQKINDNYDIPLILIFAEDTFRYRYSLAEVNYCLSWKEITPTLLETAILYALNQHQNIEVAASLKRNNSKSTSQLSTTTDLFQTIINNISTLVWIVDVKGNFAFLNQAWLSFTGKTLATGLQENWQEYIHPDDIAECKQVCQSALQKRTGFETEYRLRRFDNEYRTILITGVYYCNLQGEFTGWLCSGLDITRRKKIEQQLSEQSHADRIFAKIAKNIYGCLNIDTILQTAADEINRFFLAERVFIVKVLRDRQLNLLFESKLAVFSSCEMSDWEKLPVKEVADYFEFLLKGAIIALDNTLKSTIVSTHGNSDFTLVPCSMLILPVICDRELWGLICVEFSFAQKYWQQQKIKFLEQVAIQLGVAIRQWLLYQQLEQTNKKLAQQATIDNLTRVANRRQFDQYIALEWRRCAREKHPLSLILCDIDYFKLYNDTYGHLLGDRCLKMVALAIAKITKRPADLVARYGGEEFAVILPNTNILGAKYLAEQIRARVEALKIAHADSSVNNYVTLSLGVSCCIPSHNLNFVALIEAADKGLYQAKKLGRNRVSEFEMDKLSSALFYL